MFQTESLSRSATNQVCMSSKPPTRRTPPLAHYQVLVEQVPAIMYMAERGASGTWFYVSPQVEPILGFSAEEWMSDPGRWRKQLHPDDLEKALAAEQQLDHEGDHYKIEYRMFARDGHEVWVRDEATYVREQETNALVMRGLLIDITDRKQAEAELHRVEGQLQRILSTAPVILFVLDAAGIFTLSVGSGLKDLGLKPGEIVGCSVFDVYRDNPTILDHVRRALCGEEFIGIDEVPQVERVFQTRWAPATDSAGRTTGVIGVATDITEIRKSEDALRRSEERYRIFLAQSSEGIFRLEYAPPVSIDAPGSEQLALSLANSHIAECNDALARMYGYCSATEMLGKRLSELPSGEELAREFIANGFRISGFQSERTEHGKRSVFQTTMLGIVEQGHLARTWAIQRDMSERVRLEEQMRSTQQLEAIGRLAGGVAHDFNNVLGVILGHVQLVMEETQVSEHTRAGLGHIRRAAERAASLTQQLLAFSRKQVLQPKVLDVNEIVVEIQKMLSRVIGEDIALVTHLHPSLAGVKADRSQLEQVLMNLALNARDAMPQGGRLKMETANVELDEAFARENLGTIPGRYVLLTVTDTGTGMTPETIEHVFEPFFTTKEAGKGTGLGLATVHGVVKQSGGHILVSSELGKGSCFRVYLPAEPDPAPAQGVGEATGDATGGTETVLIVEDQPELREITSIFLHAHGYHVLEAGNAADALRLLALPGTTIDLLLTDVIMPGLSGRQLVEQVQSTRPAMKVIYMTGYTDDMVVHHKVLEPGVDLLQKPFTRDQLVRTVRSVLDRA